MSGTDRRNGNGVCHVWVQVRAPGERDPGEVALGHYTTDGAVLTLTDAAGEPLASGSGVLWQSGLRAGDDHQKIAKRLFRKARAAEASDFNRPRLAYPRLVIV